MHAAVNIFNILSIEYRERVGSPGALQHLDSTDRGSESPRPAADLFTTKSPQQQQQQPAGTAFLFHRCSGRKEVHILPFPPQNTTVLFKGSLCWRYTGGTTDVGFPVSILRCCVFAVAPVTLGIPLHLFFPSPAFGPKIGQTSSSLRWLASIYLFAHPRGHLIALRCIANRSSDSTGHKAALLSAGVPEVYLAIGLNTASFSLHLGVSKGSPLQQRLSHTWILCFFSCYRFCGWIKSDSLTWASSLSSFLKPPFSSNSSGVE